MNLMALNIETGYIPLYLEKVHLTKVDCSFKKYDIIMTQIGSVGGEI
jgi:hypothetical protein